MRDRALNGSMVVSFARIGAALGMKVDEVFTQNRRLWVGLREKGGKAHAMRFRRREHQTRPRLARTLVALAEHRQCQSGQMDAVRVAILGTPPRHSPGMVQTEPVSSRRSQSSRAPPRAGREPRSGAAPGPGTPDASPLWPAEDRKLRHGEEVHAGGNRFGATGAGGCEK